MRLVGLHRLIPAHAGKTVPTGRLWWLCPAHPRSRGENFGFAAAGAGASGSSPLTRGKLSRPRGWGKSPWLIPAHAGKTSGASPRPPPIGAHPRSRGENISPTAESSICRGSSPLTRGKPWLWMRVLCHWRLIPAHAGKTRRSAQSGRAPPAHPRSRGENAFHARVSHVLRGSSPLTRGKRSSGRPENLERRLIPAHAGKTCPTRPTTSGVSAHPRSRGENRRVGGRARCSRGSSPLTRGKRWRWSST